jgi:hypothetical protein
VLDASPKFRYGEWVPRDGQMSGALLVAACIVTVIRLKGQEIKPSPKLTITIRESVQLARQVLAELER